MTQHLGLYIRVYSEINISVCGSPVAVKGIDVYPTPEAHLSPYCQVRCLFLHPELLNANKHVYTYTKTGSAFKTGYTDPYPLAVPS